MGTMGEHSVNLELAWMAGFIDGEGTIGVSYRTDAKRQRNWYIYLSVCQVKTGVLEPFARRFGGKVYTAKTYLNGSAYGTHERWQVYGERALTAIAALLPFLRVKR